MIDEKGILVFNHLSCEGSIEAKYRLHTMIFVRTKEGAKEENSLDGLEGVLNFERSRRNLLFLLFKKNSVSPWFATPHPLFNYSHGNNPRSRSI